MYLCHFLDSASTISYKPVFLKVFFSLSCRSSYKTLTCSNFSVQFPELNKTLTLSLALSRFLSVSSSQPIWKESNLNCKLQQKREICIDLIVHDLGKILLHRADAIILLWTTGLICTKTGQK